MPHRRPTGFQHSRGTATRTARPVRSGPTASTAASAAKRPSTRLPGPQDRSASTAASAPSRRTTAPEDMSPPGHTPRAASAPSAAPPSLLMRRPGNDRWAAQAVPYGPRPGAVPAVARLERRLGLVLQGRVQPPAGLDDVGPAAGQVLTGLVPPSRPVVAAPLPASSAQGHGHPQVFPGVEAGQQFALPLQGRQRHVQRLEHHLADQPRRDLLAGQRLRSAGRGQRLRGPSRWEARPSRPRRLPRSGQEGSAGSLPVDLQLLGRRLLAGKPPVPRAPAMLPAWTSGRGGRRSRYRSNRRRMLGGPAANA